MRARSIRLCRGQLDAGVAPGVAGLGTVVESGGGDAEVPPGALVGGVELDGALIVFEGLLPVGGELGLEAEIEMRGAPGGVGFCAHFVETDGAGLVAGIVGLVALGV